MSEESIKEKGYHDIVYYIGCTSSFRMTDIAKSAIRLFQKIESKINNL